MKSIVFFNNKGGVGKTTLACNVVSYLSMYKSKRVLLVDADPQCNATQAMLDEGEAEAIYLGEEVKTKTLHSYLLPLEAGEALIDTAVTPVLGTSTAFKTDLIPGHPRMSIIEDRLSEAWAQVKSGEIGGLRVTNWAAQLLDAVRDRYDLVIFDVGPSLGALNRTVILASDYVVTPFGCDIFSLLGIKNISKWIQGWELHYNRALELARADRPGLIEQHRIITDTSAHFRFAGYSVQQYVTRKFKTGHRPVKSYDAIMQEIPATVAEAMGFITPAALTADKLSLGHIPYLYSLVPMAQSAKTPIHSLTSEEGVVGSQYAQVKSFKTLMSSLCAKLLENVGVP